MRSGQEPEWFVGDNFQSVVVGKFMGQCNDQPVKKALGLLKRLLDLEPSSRANVGAETVLLLCMLHPLKVALLPCRSCCLVVDRGYQCLGWISDPKAVCLHFAKGGELHEIAPLPFCHIFDS